MTKNEYISEVLKAKAEQINLRELFDSYEPEMTMGELISCGCIFNPQKHSPMIERRVIELLNVKRNLPSDNIGDFNYNGVNYEMKTTTITDTNKKMNFVQLRKDHICDYLFLVANVTTDTPTYRTFLIPKDVITKLIITDGGCAHGAKKDGPKEYRVSMNYSRIEEFAKYETFII